MTPVYHSGCCCLYEPEFWRTHRELCLLFIFCVLQHRLDSKKEDRLLASKIALDMENDVCEAEKHEFLEACAHLPDSERPKLKERLTLLTRTLGAHALGDLPPTPVDRVVTRRYLNQPTSNLPAPWCSLLGPLATLQPRRRGDGDSVALWTVAPVELPASLQSPRTAADAATHKDEDVAAGLEWSMDNRSDGGYSDEAEADLLLGLGTSHRSRRRRRDVVEHIPNGLSEQHSAHEAAVATAGLESDNVAMGDRSGGTCTTFDETYDLWKEWMQEEEEGVDPSAELNKLLPLDNGAASGMDDEDTAVRDLACTQD